jgi:small-conductance mechanosensitive channel
MPRVRSYHVGMKEQLPAWLQPWIDHLLLALQVLLILLVAWALRSLVRRLVARLAVRYELPPMVVMGARRVATFVIGLAALLAVLQRFGVSAGVLWGAFTGFATVAAVAFFAAWSVLTNLFCSFLILITRPFRLLDHIELLENGDKQGLRGQVVDINLIYVTLLERHPGGHQSQLRVPNSQFFQRAVRRWSGEPPADFLQVALARPSAEAASPRQGAGGGASAADAD